MTTIIDGIVIGGAGGAIVLFIQCAYNKSTQKIESNRIYKWLQKNTSKDEVAEQFKSTRVIASWNNLTENRVRHLCSIDRRIFLNIGGTEDIWSIHKREHKVRVRIG